ncbi:MAG: hypothetical protein FJY39_09435 [Betaproteobacteria bacterium]|nr:hypothetical protein [Betaproteobacteria bacterium]
MNRTPPELAALLPVSNPVTLEKLIEALCQPIRLEVDRSVSGCIELLERILDEVDAAAESLHAADAALGVQIQACETGLRSLSGAPGTEAGLLLGLWQSAAGRPQAVRGSGDGAGELIQRMLKDAHTARAPLQSLLAQLRHFRHVGQAARKLARERASGSQASARAVQAVSENMIRLRTRALLDQAQQRGWMKPVARDSALERAIVAAVLQRAA